MSINWKKIGLFAGGTLFGIAGIKILSGKESIHRLYSSSTSCKRLRNENCNNHSGECRRHLCRS